jgi:hypothetical protein
MSLEPTDPTPVDDKAEPTDGTPDADESREPRTWIERIGLAAVAVALGLMFGGVGYAAWLGGELFLAVIGAISCVMTLWVGALTLFRR